MDKRDAARFMSSLLEILSTLRDYVTSIAVNHAVSWANKGVETVKPARPTCAACSA